jgi:ATP-dependent Clp protease ATP-binding subunit ClpC
LIKDEIKHIANILLKEVFGRLAEQGITLEVTPKFMDRLVEEGYNPSYGARPLRRAIMRLLEDSLAEEILSGRVKHGDTALVDINDDGQVQVRVEQTREPLLPQTADQI